MGRLNPSDASFAAADPRGQRDCSCCGRPLSALERLRGDVCDAMDCRRRTADARARARRESELADARASAARAWDIPALASAPMVWLEHHGDVLAPPPADAVEALRDHLARLESAPPTLAGDGQGAGSGSPPGPADAHLCALCRGSCCRYGRDRQAFIRADQLRDWLAKHPGARWEEAVDHYLGFVPAEHLRDSCLFHTEQGCALPRERRSGICNTYWCETLGRVRTATAEQPDAAVVVGIVQSHGLRSATVITGHGQRPMNDPQLP